MCVGAWSTLGYVNDSDLRAVTVLPAVPPNTREPILAEGWDAIV
jgi:hypothetical protein